jgi:hypothetical protein
MPLLFFGFNAAEQRQKYHARAGDAEKHYHTREIADLDHAKAVDPLLSTNKGEKAQMRLFLAHLSSMPPVSTDVFEAEV